MITGDFEHLPFRTGAFDRLSVIFDVKLERSALISDGDFGLGVVISDAQHSIPLYDSFCINIGNSDGVFG